MHHRNRPFIFILAAYSLGLALAGCAGKPQTLLRYSLWTETQQLPSDLHLILLWDEEFAKKRGRPAAHPERLVAQIAAECEKQNFGRIASYQIFEDPADLEKWSNSFRPAIPVLKVGAKLESTESSGNWTISLDGKSRIQALLYDTGTNDTKTAVQVSRKPQPAESGNESFPRYLLKTSEDKLYADFAEKLFAKLARERQDTILPYSVGKSDKMKQAYAAAQTGNFDGAAKLWQEAADAEQENVKALENLSSYYESKGDFKKALEYHAAAMKRQPKSLRAMMYQEANEERERLLKGLIQLKDTKVPAAKILKSSGTLAILLLDNETNDLDAPVKIRKNLMDRAQNLGMKALPLDEIDEKLKMMGLTDGGQFRSTTPQKLGKELKADYLVMGSVEEFKSIPGKDVKAALKLVYAPSGETLYEKTLQVQEEEKNLLNSFFDKALAKAAEVITEKVSGKTLDEESEMLARRYMQAWPHFTSGSTAR